MASQETGGADMIDDDEMPDFDDISIGEPLNESYGAVCGMLSEHIVDADRLNRWLLGLMIVSLHEVDATEVPLAEALETITVMSHADMAIAGFDSMNTMVRMVREERKRKRGRRSTA